MINPMVAFRPDKSIYLNQFGMLADLVPSSEIERGIELDAIISMLNRIALPVMKDGRPVLLRESVRVKHNNRLPFSTLARKRILKTMGV